MSVQVAHIDEAKTGLLPDAVGAFKCCHRRRRQTLQLVLWIEPRHMPGSELAHAVFDPVSDALELGIIVVHGGDDVGDYLDMHLPFLLCSLCYLEDTAPLGYLGQFHVERIGETFDINSPGIEIRTDGIQCLWRGVAVGYIDGIQPRRFGELG